MCLVDEAVLFSLPGFTPIYTVGVTNETTTTSSSSSSSTSSSLPVPSNTRSDQTERGDNLTGELTERGGKSGMQFTSARLLSHVATTIAPLNGLTSLETELSHGGAVITSWLPRYVPPLQSMDSRPPSLPLDPPSPPLLLLFMIS